VAPTLGKRFLPRRQPAPDEQQPVGEINVVPAQREELADPQAGVEQQAEGVGIAAILSLARCELSQITNARLTAVLTVLARARERLDFLDLVIVQSRGRILTTLVSPIDGFFGSARTSSRHP
jgi:hypothetical protein